jgi:hypothetical protein
MTFALPHISAYKRRWVRRIMIVVTFPQGVVQVISGLLSDAAYWWRQP